MEITPELAEIFGIHAGDGYMRLRERGKGEIDISGHLEEKEYYNNHVVPLFNNCLNLNLNARFFSRGTYGIIIYNKKVASLFNDFGFPFGKKSLSVSVPKEILQSENLKVIAGFLRGAFDTDGNLYFRNNQSCERYALFKRKHNYYPVINFGTVSKNLAEGIVFLLDKLSIKSFMFIYDPKVEGCNKVYRITISGVERLEKWMKLVGSKNPVKFTRYLVWKEFGFCPPHTTLKQRKDILNGKIDINSVGL